MRLAGWPAWMGAIGTALIVSGCNNDPPDPQAAERRKCEERKPAWRDEVRRALDAKQHELAITLAGACAQLAADQSLLEELAQAEIKWRMADAMNIRLPADHRLNSLNALSAIAPSAAASLPRNLRQQLMRQVQRDEAASAQALKDERRKRGVSIGMTASQVLESSWGRPERVNRTTTGGGTREQWVYGDGNYLYFENGVLSAIQN